MVSDVREDRVDNANSDQKMQLVLTGRLCHHSCSCVCLWCDNHKIHSLFNIVCSIAVGPLVSITLYFGHQSDALVRFARCRFNRTTSRPILASLCCWLVDTCYVALAQGVDLRHDATIISRSLTRCTHFYNVHLLGNAADNFSCRSAFVRTWWDSWCPSSNYAKWSKVPCCCVVLYRFSEKYNKRVCG